MALARAFPNVDREDSSLEGSCGTIVEEAFDEVIDGMPFLLTEDGQLVCEKQCTAIAKPILDIWTSKNAIALLDDRARPALCRHVGPVDVEKLSRWGVVEEIDKAKLLEILQTKHLPRPETWRHPNYGSNSLVSSGELGKGTLSQPPSAVDGQIAFANACTARCLALASDYELQGSAQLILLDGRIEIASRDGESPAAVFNQKGLTHLGDGKSQQSAVQFTKARTHIEAVEMIYRYLKQEKLDLTGSRQTIEVKDGLLFEVLHTNKGPVWFKTKIDWNPASQ